MDDDNGPSCKRLKIVNMDKELQDLFDCHKQLINDEYDFLKQHLDCFQSGYSESKRVMDKFMILAGIPELSHRVAVLKNIQDKQDILYKDLYSSLELIKDEAQKQQEKEMRGLSLEATRAYIKTRIAHLKRIQQNKPTWDVESCDQGTDVQPITCSTETPSTSDVGSADDVSASGEVRSNDSSLSTLQLQMKRLEEYEAMLECPLHYKFTQKLHEANNLMTLQHEQLSITEVVLDEVLAKHKKQKEYILKHSYLLARKRALTKMAEETGSAIVSNQAENIESTAGIAATTSSHDSCQPVDSCVASSDSKHSSLKTKKKKEKTNSAGDKAAPPAAGICQFYVTHKKRYCRMKVMKNKQFCGQHLVADNTPDVSHIF